MDTTKLAELKAALAKVPDGPWFTNFDDAEDCPDHSHSGLAKVETGRSGDWWIARLCEWPIASYIALANPQTILELIAEVERLREIERALDAMNDAIVTCSANINEQE